MSPSRRGRAAVAAIGAAVLLVPAAATAQVRTLGDNLGTLSSVSGEWAFVDAFKTATGWFSGQAQGCFDCGPPLPLDADGWVTALDPGAPNGGQTASVLMFLQAQGRYPGGDYDVFWEGNGTLHYEGTVTRVVAVGPGHDRITVDPDLGDEGIVLTILSSDPAPDHVRDVRVLMPGGVCSDDPLAACAADVDCGGAPATCRRFADDPAWATDVQIFHPDVLASLAPYDVLRAVHWMDANAIEATEWVDYPTPARAFWRQAPAEVLAALAERLGTDLWVNVPHRASDDFVVELATVLRERTAPPTRIHVELSNETWNFRFPQYLEMSIDGCARYPDLQAGCDADAAPGNGLHCEGHLATPVPACEQARRRHHAERSVEVWALFEQVFGGTARLQRVLASYNPLVQQHLDYLNHVTATGTVVKDVTDVFASNGYFGFELCSDAAVLGGDPAAHAANLDALFDVHLPGELANTLAELAAVQQLLDGTVPGVRHVTYEGGQHLVLNPGFTGTPAEAAAMDALFDAANRDPRMGALYTELLEGWEAISPDVFVHFVHTMQWDEGGRWGLLEWPRQPASASPKLRAVLAYLGLAGPPPPSPIFDDDFESGGLSAWSAAIP